MKSLLKLTRAHTVPLEAVPATLGALLATGGQFTAGVAYWMLFGVLYHLIGYGHNSWTDWKNGHDKNDPNKQHHPLNTRELNPLWVGFFLFISACLFLAYTFILSVRQGGSMAHVYSLAAIGLLGALLYNEFGKETYFKFIPITVAHTTVFLVPFYGIGGSTSVPMVLAGLCVSVWIVHQIAISGELKDIQQDEYNLLHLMSFRDSAGYYVPNQIASVSASILRILYAALVLMFWTSLGGGSVVTGVTIAVLGLVTIWISGNMIMLKYRDREAAVKSMAIIEFLSLSMFCLAFIPLIGGVVSVLLITVSLLWVVSMNKIMWDTKIKPDV